MKIQNALVSNILDRSQRYFAHVTTVTLSWRVQNIVVIGRVYFTLECFEFSSNFEFDRNMLSGTGAWSSRWSQRFSQALGFARLDSVSLLFASYLDDFSSLQYRYVCGWSMRYKRFHSFMDSEPDFYFISATNPPASLSCLCASRPTFSSKDLFTSVSETCMHHGAIRCCYLISLRTKMNRGVSLWNISVCFYYNIQVLWLTSNRCWADVGGRHQPNVKATLGRHRTADIDPTSAQHMFPWSFF